MFIVNCKFKNYETVNFGRLGLKFKVKTDIIEVIIYFVRRRYFTILRFNLCMIACLRGLRIGFFVKCYKSKNAMQQNEAFLPLLI